MSRQLPRDLNICFSVLCDNPATVSLDYAGTSDERYCYDHFDYFARESDRAISRGGEDFRRGYEILDLRDFTPDNKQPCAVGGCSNRAKVKIVREDGDTTFMCLSCLNNISGGSTAERFKSHFRIKSIEKIGK